jgi:hypothetical protein
MIRSRKKKTPGYELTIGKFTTIYLGSILGMALTT